MMPLQSGFIPGDAGKEVRVIFCDISKAFDQVWHAGLIHILRAVGISGKLLDWFTNYLFERRQKVLPPGVESLLTFIKAANPQVSILGPLSHSGTRCCSNVCPFLILVCQVLFKVSKERLHRPKDL